MSGHVPQDEGELTWWQRAEHGAAVAILAVMVVVPVVSAVGRETVGFSLPGANVWVQALNLWLAFIGGTIAARRGQHLGLSTTNLFSMSDQLKAWLNGFTSAVAATVAAFLAYGSASLVVSEMGSHMELAGGVPMWVVQIGMPLGFGVMALRFVHRGHTALAGRAVICGIVALSATLAWVPAGEREWVVWAGGLTLLLAVALGAPLFTVMGGMAMLLFYGAPIPIALSAVPAETFRIVSDPMLVSLPLFTLAGYLLAEGGASKRLVDLFNAWFGWLPGGVAAAAVLVCAFFTAFTGASGVTILALGGLLLPALKEAGYDEKFAVGLLTASGSIGLLFPPSLPVILYGVASSVPIHHLYIGGFVPGMVLVGLLVGFSIVVGVRKQGIRAYLPAEDGPPFSEIASARLKLMGRAAWEAKWELSLPVLVLFGIFGGILTIFEAAACTAAYAFFTEVVVHRDLDLRQDVPRVFVEATSLMGAVLVILGVALGFTSYLVDAEVPMAVAEWVEAHVSNRIVFILALNVLLLVVGCLMDIYSAIVVVVPLILPVAEVFGMNPVHLGILFLANLELGYLTPPVGLNLFLASFRFKIPLTRVYRYAMPFLGVMGLGVLFIAYVPSASTWALEDTSAEPAPNFFEDDSLLEEDAPPKALTPEQLEAMMNELDDDADDGTPALPKALSPEQLEAMMNELEEDEEPQEPDEGGKPPAPGELDMGSIFDELEED